MLFFVAKCKKSRSNGAAPSGLLAALPAGNLFNLPPLPQKVQTDWRDMVERAKQQIDAAAEHLKCFLDIEKSSSQLLIDEVTTEQDLNQKLDKFLHLITDRLQYQHSLSTQSSIPQTSETQQQIPTTKEELAAWATDLNATVAEQERVISEWQQRFELCKREIDETVETTTKERQQLKDQLSQALSENASLTEQLSKEKKDMSDYSGRAKMHSDEIAELRKEVAELRQMAKVLPDIVTVQRQKSKIMIESAELRELSNRQIAELREENFRLREKLHEKKEIIRELRHAKSRQASACKRERIQKEAELTEEREKVTRERARLKVTQYEAEELHGIQSELTKKNRELELKIVELRRQLSESEQEHERFKSDTQKTIEGLREERSKLCDTSHQFQLSLVERDGEIERLSKRSTRQQEEIVQLKAKFNELELKLSAIQEENQCLKEKYGEVEGKGVVECAGCGFDVTLLQKKFEHLESAIDSLHSTLTDK